MTTSTLTQMTSEDRREEGIKRMGTWLLQGWVMTENVCPKPGCDIILFRSRDGATLLCPLCDDPVRPIPPVLQVAEVVEPEPRPRPVVNGMADDVDEVEEDEDDGSLPPLQDAEGALRRRAASDRASRLMGQRLLNGWAMLAESCESPSCLEVGVPLMRRGAVTLCVLCENTSVENNDAVVTEAPPSVTQIPLNPPAAQPAASRAVRAAPAPAAAPAAGPSTAPQPTTSAPQQQQPKQKRPHPASSSSPRAKPDSQRRRADAAPAFDRMDEDNTAFEVDDLLEDDYFDAHADFQGGPHDGGRGATATASTLASGGVGAVLTATVSALGSRLGALKAQLARCGDPKEILEVCRAIEGCADAIRACRAAAGKV
ncbi:hypothetical protein HDU96_009014 [Phlyctochytrium bullatum]|nr:hypothetical protein HDU96_009014 [Phlyctochytrium bullatum]